MNSYKYLVLFGLLLLASSVVYGLDDNEEALEKEFGEFVARGEELVRGARGRKAVLMAASKAKIDEAIEKERSRTKRDTTGQEGNPGSDAIKTFQDLFSQVKDGFNTAIQNVGSNDFYKQASEKLSVIGNQLGQTAQKIEATVKSALEKNSGTS